MGRPGRGNNSGIITTDRGALVLPDRPGTTPLRVERDGFALEIVDEPGSTRLRASWTEHDGTPGALDVSIELPEGHESLNVVIPWSDERFNYTSKHQARPATGQLTVGDRHSAIGDRRW